MIDITYPARGIRHWLQNDDQIAVIVGDRIRESHIEDEDSARSAQYPMIIIDLHSGSLPHDLSRAWLDMHIYVYSRVSKEDASEIFKLVLARLHAQHVAEPGGSSVLVAECKTGPSDLSGWVDTARAYFVRTSWRVFVTTG